MQAIILAAGMGKRLKQLTQNNTKCMVKVNGVPLINRTLNQLEQHNLSRIVIVTGYEGQKLREHIEGLHIKTPVVFIDNPVYDRTNNIYSLFLAKDYLLKEDTLLLESDINPNILLSLVIEIIFLPNPLLRIRSRDHHRRRQRLPHIHSRVLHPRPCP